MYVTSKLPSLPTPPAKLPSCPKNVPLPSKPVPDSVNVNTSPRASTVSIRSVKSLVPSLPPRCCPPILILSPTL